MKSKFFFILSFSFIVSYSQISKPIIIKDAVSLSKDRYDNIFYVTTSQDVRKYGDENLNYSPQRRKEITNIEAWNSVRIFLFSKEFQEYTILDKYLTEIYTKAFKIDNVGFASYATIALDGNVWLFDNTDFSLKKINIQTGEIITQTSLNFIITESENEILHIKEYGNYIYMSTVNNGILVFDNLGTYKKKLHFNNVDFFNFSADELYFYKKSTAEDISNDNYIEYFDLMKLETRKEVISLSPNKVIKGKENLYYTL